MNEHLKTELSTEISMHFVPHAKTETKTSLPLRVSYHNLRRNDCQFGTATVFMCLMRQAHLLENTDQKIYN